jgi:hypothetical protein
VSTFPTGTVTDLLGEDTFEELFALRRVMSPEQAVAEATALA